MWKYIEPTGPTLDIHLKGKKVWSTPFPRELNIIPDYNGEGEDSVESEAFDIGYGCEVDTSYPIPGAPDIIQIPITAAAQWNYEEERRSEEDKDRVQDEYLKKHGIY